MFVPALVLLPLSCNPAVRFPDWISALGYPPRPARPGLATWTEVELRLIHSGVNQRMRPRLLSLGA